MLSFSGKEYNCATLLCSKVKDEIRMWMTDPSDFGDAQPIGNSHCDENVGVDLKLQY